MQDLFITSNVGHMTHSQVREFRHNCSALAGIFAASIKDVTYAEAYDIAHSRIHITNGKSNCGYITTVLARERSVANPCQAFIKAHVEIWLNSDDPSQSLPHLKHEDRIAELSRRALNLFCDLHPSLRLSGRDKRNLRKIGYLDSAALDRIALKIVNYSASSHRAKTRSDCDSQMWHASDSNLNRTRLSQHPIHRNQTEDYYSACDGYLMDFNLSDVPLTDESSIFRFVPSRRQLKSDYGGAFPPRFGPKSRFDRKDIPKSPGPAPFRLVLGNQTPSKTVTESDFPTSLSSLPSEFERLNISNDDADDGNYSANIPAPVSHEFAPDSITSFCSVDDRDKRVPPIQPSGFYARYPSTSVCLDSSFDSSHTSLSHISFPHPSPSSDSFPFDNVNPAEPNFAYTSPFSSSHDALFDTTRSFFQPSDQDVSSIPMSGHGATVSLSLQNFPEQLESDVSAPVVITDEFLNSNSSDQSVRMKPSNPQYSNQN